MSKWVGATAHNPESSQPTRLEQNKEIKKLSAAHLDHLLMNANMGVGLKIGNIEVSTGRPLVSTATPAVPGPATTASQSPQPLLLKPITPTWFRPHCPTSRTTAGGTKKWSEVAPTGEKLVKKGPVKGQYGQRESGLGTEANRTARIGGRAPAEEWRRECGANHFPEQSLDFQGSNIAGPYMGPIGWAVTPWAFTSFFLLK